MTTNQDREKFEAWYDTTLMLGNDELEDACYDAWQAALQSQQAAAPSREVVFGGPEVRARMLETGLPTAEDHAKLAAKYTDIVSDGGMDPRNRAAAELGDIRALKHRIHELEGEVIGYKRILDEQAEAEPAAWMDESGHPTVNKYSDTDSPLYAAPPAMQSAEKPCAVMEVTVGMGVTFTGIPEGTTLMPGDTFRLYKNPPEAA